MKLSVIWVSLSLVFAAHSVFANNSLIGGEEVPSTVLGGAVVMLDLGGGSCSATIVGPRTIITAGHCAAFSANASFSVAGQKYAVKLTFDPQYNSSFDFSTDPTGLDYDIAVGITDRNVANVTPITVGGIATVGTPVTLLGYGCTMPNEQGGNNGVLKAGKNVINVLRGTGMVLAGMNMGASGCSGDSGGPGLLQSTNGAFYLFGVADEVPQDGSGNFAPETWEVITTTPPLHQFLATFATQNRVQICGINANCAPVFH